jgi:dihydroorotase
MHCDYAFYVGATPQNVGALGELERIPGVAGVKAFLGSSTGTLLLSEEDAILAALKGGRRAWPFIRRTKRGSTNASISRSPAIRAAIPSGATYGNRAAVDRACAGLARKAGRRLHVLHVTTADELPLLAAARDLATVETTPQHLTLAAPECYERLGTYAQMNPPIREASHRDALWQAVREGLIDVIGSDHAPHTREEKDKVYPNTPSGMPGVQTLATILLDHVNAGRMTLERFVDLTSAGAARIFGIAGKGRIARGYRRRFHDRRSEKETTHREQLDRIQMRLDAVRRHGNHRLARCDDHPWTDDHARSRARAGRAGRKSALRRNHSGRMTGCGGFFNAVDAGGSQRTRWGNKARKAR